MIEIHKGVEVIKVGLGNKGKYIDTSSICYCQAEGCYTHIFFNSGNTYLISRPLAWLENLLNEEHFYRCHRSYLVNIQKIDSLDIKNRIIFQELYQIPISYRELVSFLYKCNSYIIDKRITIY